MPAPRRAAQAQAYIPFLRLSDFTRGGGLPEGDYLWSALDLVMFQPTKRDNTIVGPAKLCVRITMIPVGGTESSEQHYSLGTNAHLSVQPDPDTGKRLVPVLGGPAAPLYETTNWHVVVKSLYDSGMPPDYAIDDLSVLEGIVAHMTNIPEPEERKGFRSSTAEVSVEQKDRKIAVVLEIKDAPWMEARSLRGVDAPLAANQRVATASAASALASRQTSRLAPTPRPAPAAAVPRTNGSPASPPAPPANPNLEVDAAEAISAVLEANGNTMKRLSLRMAAFKLLGDHPDKQQIMNTYFADEAAMGALLNQLGFTVNGDQVVALT